MKFLLRVFEGNKKRLDKTNRVSFGDEKVTLVIVLFKGVCSVFTKDRGFDHQKFSSPTSLDVSVVFFSLYQKI